MHFTKDQVMRRVRGGMLLLAVVVPWFVSVSVWGQGSGTPASGAGTGGVVEAEGVLFDPPAIYLTWQRDPTTTMTIDWHTEIGAQFPRASVVQYQPAEGAEEGAWREAPGMIEAFPYVTRNVHRVELTGLKPDTMYRFRFGEDSRAYLFRTMPAALSRPVRFVVGGDTGTGDPFRKIAGVAMEHAPDFIVIGGDLAYADGGDRDRRRGEIGVTSRWWRAWFDIVKETMITEEGRVVPMLVAIGNHEVRQGYHTSYPAFEPTEAWRERLAPIFYNVFAFPGQPGYAAMDFGDYLSLIILDSDHTNPVVGEQTRWLEQMLSERAGRVPHVFPVYHVAAYPSLIERDFDRPRKRQIREHWHPLFERYGIDIAFEHHDHTYKRTHPIRGGRVDPEGVVYIGDGSFGLGRDEARILKPQDTWYLKKAMGEVHFILVTLDKSGRRLTMINDEREVIDTFPER